jgi:kynurenine 3-monooxygenase
VLLGDAAHAIVPFYGQGMNASFEDVFVFDEILNKHQGNWKTVLTAYEKTRRKDTDAIANLALDNFHEMKEHTANPLFQEKRKLEMSFEGQFPTQYSSKYSLVTFNEDISYHQAMTRGRAQDKTILKLLTKGLLPDSMQTKEKLKLVQQQTNALLQEID